MCVAFARCPALCCALVAGILGAGCVPLGSTRAEIPAASIVPYLPSDLREGQDKVLLIAQFTKRVSRYVRNQQSIPDSSERIISAYVAAASELESVTRQFQREFLYSTRVYFLDYPSPASITTTAVSLDLLCLVVLDGRTIRLIPYGPDTYKVESGTISALERDQSVEGWRKIPIDKPAPISGPCGTSGLADWDQSLRTRAVRFMGQISAR